MEVQKERGALSERLEEILAELMKKMEEFGTMKAETTAELRKIKERGRCKGGSALREELLVKEREVEALRKSIPRGVRGGEGRDGSREGEEE